MSIRRFWLALAVSLVPAGLQADSHKGDAAAAPSYAHLSNLFGLQASAAKTLDFDDDHDAPGRPKIGEAGAHEHYPWAVVVDVGVHFLGPDDETAWTLMAGPRYTLPHENHRRLAFVQALAGVGYTRRGGKEGQRGFSWATGAGVDSLLDRRGRYAVRLQADLIGPRSGAVYPRISLGFVVRFLGEHERSN